MSFFLSVVGQISQSSFDE